jgi:hypothetical protein
MFYNVRSMLADPKVLAILLVIPISVIVLTRCSIPLPTNPFAGPESALDGIVDVINNKRMANLCDYVYGDCVWVNVDQLEKTFPGTKKILSGKVWISEKEYKKLEADDTKARFHVQAYVKFTSPVGVEGQKFVDFDAVIVKQMGKWRISKESLQSLWSALTTLY